MKSRSILFLAIALSAVCTISAQAGPFNRGVFTGFGFDRENAQMREIGQAGLRHLLNFRKETPLTADQKKEVASVLESHRDDIRAQMESSRDARRNMEAAVKEHGPDAPEASQAADQIGQIARDRALLTARILSEVRPLLTPEQLDRIEDAREELQSMVDEALMAAAK